MTIRLFISYRRSDAEHAAQRVRAAMRARFGDDAVFIDRDIPAGDDWAPYLKEKLAEATEVIVLVGDAFIKELRRRSNGATAQQEVDVLKDEIASALLLKKKIYPVVIGKLDMPDRRRLPQDIGDFADWQAVFAREPAFDTAMGKLADAIAASRGWVAPPQEASPAQAAAGTAASLALAAAALLLLTVLLGWLIEYLALGEAGGRFDRAFWFGAHYLLLTLVLGLGPYLVYRTVAEMRVRASLPVRNLLGTLTMVNMAVAKAAAGIFLLLSTRADWALRLQWVMPADPSVPAYALQGLLLVIVVFAAVPVALLEPAVRRLPEPGRQRGMGVLLAASSAALLGNAWLLLSLWESRPSLEGLCPISLIGYFSLAPALPFLMITWAAARERLGLNTRALHSRLLINLALCLYVLTTLSYYAHGPLQLMTGTPISAACPVAPLPAHAS